MKKEDVVCGQCGQSFRMLAKEKKRQMKKGRTVFFCGLACAAVYHNMRRHVKLPPETRTCAECGLSFRVECASSPKRFCSRSCASRGSVTPLRSEKSRAIAYMNVTWVRNFARNDVILRKREHWKYAMIEGLLNGRGIAHMFEYCIGKCVFDLALTELKCLIEFDGPYHRTAKQRERDAAKDALAIEQGWSVIRVAVPPNKAIEPSSITIVLDMLKVNASSTKQP